MVDGGHDWEGREWYVVRFLAWRVICWRCWRLICVRLLSTLALAALHWLWGTGRVRLARHKRTRKLAAIKIIPKVHIGAGRVDPKAERVMQSIRREMVVMKLIHHPNIMDMYDVYEDQDELCVSSHLQLSRSFTCS